jgi:hypothetical protein
MRFSGTFDTSDGYALARPISTPAPTRFRSRWTSSPCDEVRDDAVSERLDRAGVTVVSVPAQNEARAIGLSIPHRRGWIRPLCVFMFAPDYGLPTIFGRENA